MGKPHICCNKRPRMMLLRILFHMENYYGQPRATCSSTSVSTHGRHDSHERLELRQRKPRPSPGTLQQYSNAMITWHFKNNNDIANKRCNRPFSKCHDHTEAFLAAFLSMDRNKRIRPRVDGRRCWSARLVNGNGWSGQP
eukprot:6045421-Amphidinium_carterae.2